MKEQWKTERIFRYYHLGLWPAGEAHELSDHIKTIFKHVPALWFGVAKGSSATAVIMQISVAVEGPDEYRDHIFSAASAWWRADVNRAIDAWRSNRGTRAPAG